MRTDTVAPGDTFLAGPHATLCLATTGPKDRLGTFTCTAPRGHQPAETHVASAYGVTVAVWNDAELTLDIIGIDRAGP